MGVNKVIYNGSTLIDLTGTTATADKILSGYGAFGADGVWMDGTASGGGATNIIHGTFTTGSTTGAAESHDLPYTGDGYPIMFLCWIKGGAYNNSGAGNTDWYNLVKRYTVGVWGMVKSRTTAAPTYATSGAANYGTSWAIYKNSTSSATSYTRTSSMSANIFSSSNANATATTNIRFRTASRISVFVSASSYGLWAETEYEYIALYSE